VYSTSPNIADLRIEWNVTPLERIVPPFPGHAHFERPVQLNVYSAETAG